MKICVESETEEKVFPFNFRWSFSISKKECQLCICGKQKENKTNKIEKLKLYRKNSRKEKEEKLEIQRKECPRNRRKTACDFRMICNTTRKIIHALKRHSEALLSTEVFGTKVKLFEKWIQLPLTEEITTLVIGNNHLNPTKFSR